MPEIDSEFVEEKKAVASKTALEVVNHISSTNLDVVAAISELMVEETLEKLESSIAKLVRVPNTFTCDLWPLTNLDLHENEL